MNNSSSLGDCVVIGETVENVMPNLFRHLIEPSSYETLNQVQGDKIVIATQSLDGRGLTIHFQRGIEKNE